MNTINIGLPTLENVESVMETIGFTKDTTLSTQTTTYWKWDSVGKAEIYYDSSNYAFGYRWGGNNTSAVMIDGGTNTKVCYENLANGGISIGWSQNATTPLHLSFVAPSTAGDTWVFVPFSSAYFFVCDYSTDNLLKYYNASGIYNDIGEVSNDVQIIALYNGVRFMNNIYLTVLQPSLQSNDSVRVAIGTKTYLFIKTGNSTYKSCFAVEVAA